MESVPVEILALILDCLPLHDLVLSRRTCKKFHQAVATLAPVEEIPSLLLMKNFTEFVPFDPSTVSKSKWRGCHMEQLDIVKEIPAVHRVHDTFGAGFGVFAGKLNDAVWNSKLVTWLRRRKSLNQLPWREIIAFRVARNQAEFARADWFENSSTWEEPTPLAGVNAELRKPNSSLPLLPVIKGTEQPVFGSNWREQPGMIVFRRSKRKWRDLLKASAKIEEGDVYTDSDDDWAGSTTTSEGRSEWAGWTLHQLDLFLKKMRSDLGLSKKYSPITLLDHEKTRMEVDVLGMHPLDEFCVCVQLANHLFYIMW